MGLTKPFEAIRKNRFDLTEKPVLHSDDDDAFAVLSSREDRWEILITEDQRERLTACHAALYVMWRQAGQLVRHSGSRLPETHGDISALSHQVVVQASVLRRVPVNTETADRPA